MENATQPIHAAIIMDGNGRWAQGRGLPRIAGHRAGAATVRRVVKASPDLGITSLTLYAFSSDNWRRPETEVRSLMLLLARYLRNEANELRDSGVRLSIIGRRDRLPANVIEAIQWAEARTSGGSPAAPAHRRGLFGARRDSLGCGFCRGHLKGCLP